MPQKPDSSANSVHSQQQPRKRPRNWSEAGKQMAEHDPETIARMLKEFLHGDHPEEK